MMVNMGGGTFLKKVFPRTPFKDFWLSSRPQALAWSLEKGESFLERVREKPFFQKRFSRPYKSIHRSQGGFTLIELLVVMVIAGVAVSMAAVNLAPSPTRILRAEARRAAIALEAARDTAIFTGRPVGWRADKAEIVFLAPSLDGGWAEENAPAAPLKIENGAAITQLLINGAKVDQDFILAFHPHGLPGKFSLTLALADKTSMIHGTPFGIISMEDPR